MRSNTGSNRVRLRRLGARTPTHEPAPAGEEAVANGQTPNAQPMPGQSESDAPNRSSIVERPFYCLTHPPLPFHCSTRLQLLYACHFQPVTCLRQSRIIGFRSLDPFSFRPSAAHFNCTRHRSHFLKVPLALLGGECAGDYRHLATVYRHLATQVWRA